MIDFIPLSLYIPLFNFLVLFLVLTAAYQGFSNTVFSEGVKLANSISGAVIALLLIFYIGLRPMSGYYFGDTLSYARSFFILQENVSRFEILYEGEWVFNSLMRWFAIYSDVHMFFLLCSFVYVGALWWALVRIFKEDYFIPLIVVISMLTFFSYGVNGVRNGMASSIVILALSFRRNLPVAIGLCIIALGIHKSLMLTVFAGALALFVKNPKLYLAGWFGAILVSLATGEAVSNMILSLGLIGDDRFENYLHGEASRNVFSKVGFRWDFLLYSAMPVFVGWYIIFKKNYTDKFYVWLFNIYLTTNAFWIIVIRANYSNRFAQISWFIMPLVFIYPFFMHKIWNDQQQKIGGGVIIFYLYTFYMVIIKGKIL